MLYVVCLACVLLICVNAELSVRCNDDTNTTNMNFVTLEPSPDHVQVPGRYVLEWCTAAKANKAAWLFYINYNLSFKPDQCKLYIYKNDKKFQAHSRFEESTNINLNCSHVCFSTSVDLIFGACYHIKNQLLTQKHSTESYDQLIYITNNFANSSILNKSHPYTTVSNSEDYVSVQWFMGPVPAADFKMDLDTVPESGVVDVTRNCSNAVHTVACVLRVPQGAYILMFSHNEPWRYGSVAPLDTNLYFNRTGAEAPPLVGSMSVGGAAWWGAAGACGAVALCVSAALLQRRRSRTRSQRCKAEDEAEAEAGVAAKAGGVRVLLLYARDCAALLEVARRLGALLRHVAPDGVYEVHAAGVSAQAARAPAAWLRALVGREDVRVVLLQSPAAACLYAAQLHERGSTLPLARPLVCGRAAPRRPHCGDALLQLALRLMSEGAPPHALPYRKYYVAEISGLEANVVPLVTPQRRYVLPAATALLLHDVAASAPPASPAPPAQQDQLLQQRDQLPLQQLLERQLAEPLAQFTRAVEELQEYVRENPDYLNDNLIFL